MNIQLLFLLFPISEREISIIRKMTILAYGNYKGFHAPESFHPGSNLLTYFPLVALEFVWIVNAKILHVKILHDTQQIKHIFSLHKCMGVTRFFTPHGFLIRGESLSFRIGSCKIFPFHSYLNLYVLKILRHTERIKYVFNLYQCMGITRVCTPHGLLIR